MASGYRGSILSFILPSRSVPPAMARAPSPYRLRYETASSTVNASMCANRFTAVSETSFS